jgi:hypothetical protein
VTTDAFPAKAGPTIAETFLPLFHDDWHYVGHRQ